MDMLGLGVRLNFDDNMSSQINPLIRDLERLRNSARRTTETFNNMSGAYNPFSTQRRREIQDYMATVQNTDQALLNISDRLIRATNSANSLASAVNRMQFTGRFNQMYSDITRVQRMLGNMGYGMSKMQKDMANNRAYNMLNYQMRDLQDRIKLTTKVIQEMQSSPDSSRFREQISLAQRSLQAYQAQLRQIGSLEQRLASTHGMGTASYGGRPVLYERASSPQEELRNRLLGASMMDMAVASNIAYNSLDRTGKMMTGFGYTTMEARMKLTQMLTQLQMVGLGLTQFLTVPLGIATVALGVFLNKWEEASNIFHARTLIDPSQWSKTEDALRDMAVNTGATQLETSGAMANAYNIFGDTKGLDYSLQQAEKSLFMFKVHGVSAEKSLRDVNQIMSKFGVSSEQAWDMYVAGAIEAKKETGKGFTGMGGVDRISDYVDENAKALMGATGAMGKYAGAYEKMTQAYEKGIMENLIESIGTLGSIVIAVIKPTTPVLEKFFGTLKSGLESVLGFFREHETLSKFIAFTGMIATAIGILIGPIALATAFMIRYRNIIQGVTQAVVAFNKGGLAVLSPQARMASNLMRSLTVAIARFPQTLLAGAIPALYTFVRGLPALALNIARLNPLMTALTIGTIAYAKNWGGFGDKVRSVTKDVKESWTDARDLVSKGLSNEAFNLKDFSGLTQTFAKMQGTALIAKKVLTSIFGGTELKFDKGEMNLMQGLGIEGFINTIARTGKQVKDFWEGFKDGVKTSWDALKTFYGWMKDTFAPIFTFLKDVVIGFADTLSRLLGGDGISSFDDIRKSASELNKDVFNLGKLAGTVLSAFLGYKVLKSVFSIFKNPFAGFISSARTATRAVQTMSGAIRRMPSMVTGGGATTAPVARNASTTIAGGGMATGTLSNRQRRRLTAQQEATYGRTLSNINAQNRGHRDMGTAVHGQAGQRYGSTLYARNQSRLTRALFGQSYDTFDESGRRRQRERVGGLFNRDRTNLNNLSLRDRVTDGRQALGNQVRSAGTSIRSMGTAFASTPVVSGARARAGAVGGAVRGGASRALRPITVPVNYVTGRLRTAGVLRQATQAGTQSGNRFTRAFNMASRTLGAGGRMFGGVVRGAGTAGARAGNGMLKGMGFLGKGITGIFKLGLRAIPFLGWALMAWDIISAVFTNWDAIVKGAKKAWEWIKTDGVQALGSAWEWVQQKAGEVWQWILTDGKTMFINVTTTAIELWGKAWVWILTKAGEVFVWILTDGIAMAVQLGADIFKWVGQAFTDLVGWAIGKFGEIVGAVWDIGVSIGSSIFEAIKSGFGDIGEWIAGKVSGAVEWGKKLIGGGGKDPKKHARGGIINAPHLGLVGEAGPEAIIPLSGNQRDRARNLLTHTAGILGMDVQRVSPEETSVNNFAQEMKSAPPVKANPIVRKNGGNSGATNTGDSGSQDNSITIQNLNLNIKDGKEITETGGKKHAIAIAKELQKIMKQERLRGGGKNLTLEELILNL